MFKSIKEKLTLIKNNPENQTHAVIANYLLDCIEYKKTPKIKDCSEQSYCAESVITAFAKKYGYDGFKELAIRVKVETEYYDYSLKYYNQNSKNITNNYRSIIDDSLNMIDAQIDKIEILINAIKNSKNIYTISSYQQLFNTELFMSELQLLGYNSFFNYQRKLNEAWIKKINTNDTCIIVAFGLDNQYVVNYYNLAKNLTKNIFIICSPSQKHKFSLYKEAIIVDYANRATFLESTRSSLIMYLFSYIIYNL